METITLHLIDSSRHIQVFAHRRGIVERILFAQVGNHPVQRFGGGLGAGGVFLRRAFPAGLQRGFQFVAAHAAAAVAVQHLEQCGAGISAVR